MGPGGQVGVTGGGGGPSALAEDHKHAMILGEEQRCSDRCLRGPLSQTVKRIKELEEWREGVCNVAGGVRWMERSPYGSKAVNWF